MSNQIVSEMGLSEVKISLKSNEVLVKQTKKNTQVGFYIVGKIYYVNEGTQKDKDWKMKGIDFIQEMVLMSKAEQLVVNMMKDSFKWDKSIHSLEFAPTFSAESVQFNSEYPEYVMSYKGFLHAFKLLHKKDFMRRVSKHRYMFNPEFFKLTGDLIEVYKLLWSEAKAFDSVF